MKHRVALILSVVTLVLAGACGGRAEVFEEGAPKPQQRGVTLPEPVPATPVFLARSDKPLNERAVERIASTEGVAVAAPMTMRRVAVEGPVGRVRLRVASVEPLEFRSVAPPSTRDAEFVWISLIVGRAVPTFDAAGTLGLDGSGEIAIDGTPGFKVGAFADNAVPNIADILVNNGTERTLNLGRPTLVLVGAGSGVTIESLGRDLRKRLPGVRFERLIAGDTVPAQQTGGAPAPVGYIEGGVIGGMSFEILPNGFIRPDPAWVSANIATASVPILGEVTCHRLLIPRLERALADVADAGLAGEIRPGDYGGCYVPRFIDRDPGKSLSKHAFGLAVDLNVSTNQLGSSGDMDPRIVEIFARYGFAWGGYWSRPDPMHFEL